MRDHNCPRLGNGGEPLDDFGVALEGEYIVEPLVDMATRIDIARESGYTNHGEGGAGLTELLKDFIRAGSGETISVEEIQAFTDGWNDMEAKKNPQPPENTQQTPHSAESDITLAHRMDKTTQKSADSDIKPAVMRAYRAWRRASDSGYGETTTKAAMDRIDANIRRLKAKYEQLASKKSEGDTL